MDGCSDKPQKSKSCDLTYLVKYLFYDLLLFTSKKCCILCVISIGIMVRNTSQDAMWMQNKEVGLKQSTSYTIISFPIAAVQYHADANSKTLRIVMITFCRCSKWTQLLLKDTDVFKLSEFPSMFYSFPVSHICAIHLSCKLFGAVAKEHCIIAHHVGS